MITFRKAASIGLVVAASGAVLAGCAAAPTTTPTSAGPSTPSVVAPAGYLPCMVSDTGGYDDHSFNELSKDGLDAAGQALGVTPIALESKTDSDYKPNIDTLIKDGCTYIIADGFLLDDAVKAAATANPTIHFSVVDDDSVDLPNVKGLLSETDQAAFLGGYAAASYSKSGVVGEFGGMQIPPVTIYMDGFAEGVAYYNSQKSASVKVVGWDVASQKGSFTGGFDANDTAKADAQSLIDQGADVLMPVGGPIYQSAAAAIQDSGKPIALIGVDADVYVTDPSVDSIILTSVLKNVGSDVQQAIMDDAAGKFTSDPYVGTLENGGLGLSKFYKTDISSTLESELATIQQGIISGSIPVTSVSSVVG